MSLFDSYSPFTNLADGKALDYPSSNGLSPDHGVLLSPSTIFYQDKKGDGTAFQLKTDETNAVNGNWRAFEFEFRIAGTLSNDGFYGNSPTHNPTSVAFDSGWITITTPAQTPGRDFTREMPGTVRGEFEAIADIGTFYVTRVDEDDVDSEAQDEVAEADCQAVIKGAVYFDRWRFIDEESTADIYAWTEIAMSVWITSDYAGSPKVFFHEAGGGPKSGVLIASNLLISPGQYGDLPSGIEVGEMLVTRAWGATGWGELPPVKIYLAAPPLGNAIEGSETAVDPVADAVVATALDGGEYTLALSTCELRSTAPEGTRDAL